MINLYEHQVVFEKIFSDKSDVVGNLHKRRKDWDTVTTDWSGEGRIKTRVTDFKFNIVSKIPKMPTEVFCFFVFVLFFIWSLTWFFFI